MNFRNMQVLFTNMFDRDALTAANTIGQKGTHHPDGKYADFLEFSSLFLF